MSGRRVRSEAEPDDERGTLNRITPEKRRRAAALVREGIAVSCAWDIDPTPAADHVFGSPERRMRSSGERLRPGQRYGGASAYVGLVFHGHAVTHLDALAHHFWDGRALRVPVPGRSAAHRRGTGSPVDPIAPF